MYRIRLAVVLLGISFAASPVLAVDPILPSLDPCLLSPESCSEIFPIDPCISNPASCIEILPINPCILNPASCIEILPIDPCVLAPETCAGPPPFDPDYAFGGMQKVKVAGAGKQVSVTMQMFQVSGLGLFTGMDEEDHDYAGAWVPVGKSGRKFALTLDTASQAALASKIAAVATTMTGAVQNVTFSRSPKIVVKLDDAGDGTLKIKCKGVLDGTNVRVAYKAKLVGGSIVRVLLP